MAGARRIAAFALAASLCAGASADRLPERLELSYAVRFGKISIGTMHKTLERDASGDRYRVRSRTEPSGLGGLISDDQLLEEGQFRVVGNEVQPLYYRVQRNGSKEFDRVVRFNWDDGELEFGDGRRQALPAGTQDSGSLLFALMLDRFAPGSHKLVHLTDGKSLRQYRYAVETTETIDTPLGTVSTVRVLRRHPSKPSETRLWLATEHRHLPVRIEQDRAGQPTTVMELESVKGL